MVASWSCSLEPNRACTLLFGRPAARYGITGVPFFVADGTYAVSGAQPPEVLLQLLRRAYDDTSQLTPVAVTTDSDSGTSCDGDCRVAG